MFYFRNYTEHNLHSSLMIDHFILLHYGRNFKLEILNNVYFSETNGQHHKLWTVWKRQWGSNLKTSIMQSKKCTRKSLFFNPKHNNPFLSQCHLSIGKYVSFLKENIPFPSQCHLSIGKYVGFLKDSSNVYKS